MSDSDGERYRKRERDRERTRHRGRDRQRGRTRESCWQSWWWYSCAGTIVRKVWWHGPTKFSKSASHLSMMNRSWMGLCSAHSFHFAWALLFIFQNLARLLYRTIMNDSLKASNNMQHNFLPSFGPAFARRKRRNLSSWESVFGFLVRQWGWDDPFRWKRRRTRAYRQRISRCWFGQTSRTCCRPLFSVVAQLSLVPIAGSPPQQFSCNFNSRDQHKESLLRGAQLQTASGESCSNNCSLICDRKSNNRDCLIEIVWS